MMDSSAAETQTHAERREGSALSTSSASGLGGDGSNLKKASLRGTSSKPANSKSKKPRKARVSRPVQMGYTVQQGEDMLFVISSSTSQYDGSVWTPPKRGTKKRNRTKGMGKAIQIKRKKTVSTRPKMESHTTTKLATYIPENSTDYKWGQNVPEELLINIFKMVVIQDGPVPFLCR